MPAKARINDIQNGIKSIEIKIKTEAKILSIITISYTLSIKIQTNRLVKN